MKHECTKVTTTISEGGQNLNTYTTEPRWFAHWWSEQRDRDDQIGCYADEVEAEGRIPFHPTPLHEITNGEHENFTDLVEDAWFEWEDETRQSPQGWAYIENLLNHLYPEEVERGPSHRVLLRRCETGHVIVRQI